MKRTSVYLNTWRNYNNGGIGYGWMTAEEAREFIASDPERDGGEWFIADLDNYTGLEFRNLDYANVAEILDTLEALEALEDWEREEVVALMEYNGYRSAQDAIDDLDNHLFYSDIDEYHSSLDDLVDDLLHGVPDTLKFYFDYGAYYRDADMDIYEASNGVVIAS